MEEIIIDGINVAGCVLYNNGKCRDLGHLVQGEYMECNSMCDYGAYARKEQLKRLEQENAELKTVHKQLKQMIKSKESLLEKAIQEKSTIEYMLHLAEQENEKLKQALEEIREIAKENYYSCTDCEKQRKEFNCNDKCNAYRLNEIQRKINEVLNEE